MYCVLFLIHSLWCLVYCHCFLFSLRHLFLFIGFSIAMSPLNCFSTDQQSSSETLRLLSAYLGGTKHFIETPPKNKKERLRLYFFHWPEVFSLRVKEKQQRSGQKVKMVNPTCKMLIPQKSVDFCFILAGWTSTMYPENCHPKDTGPIQKHPLNLPWCGETEYQNEKLLPIFFCHQKKLAGMFLLCADAGWL